ncbi:MAG: hypothetical protein V5A62_19405 [Haloarculaceae archaeon]
MEFSSAERRLAGRGALAVGILHVLLPELLVDALRFAYDVLLDVSFVPRDRTARRIRLLGVALLLFGVALSLSADR